MNKLTAFFLSVLLLLMPLAAESASPVITSSAVFSVAENQTAVGTVTATDADGDTLTYSLSGSDAASFSISSSGVITFNSAPDYETKTSYAITVNVSDGANTTSQALTINVTDVLVEDENDPPVVSEVTWSPATGIDLTDGDAELTFNFRVTDASGVGVEENKRIGGFRVGATINNQYRYFMCYYWASHRISGDAKDGTYEFKCTLEKYKLPTGTYTLADAGATDMWGNEGPDVVLTDDFVITNEGSENDPPVVSEVTWSPATGIDLTDGDAELTFNFRVTDASGVGDPGDNGIGLFSISRPNEPGTTSYCEYRPSHRISGDAKDGTYEFKCRIGKYRLPAGTYKLEDTGATDVWGNRGPVVLLTDDFVITHGYLTLIYADKPIAGVKMVMTESDDTVTIFSTDTNGNVARPDTTNTYTLSASLAETGVDPVELLDAIWILQHAGELRNLTAAQQKAADVTGDGAVDLLDAIYILQHMGELRTLNPSLVFLDTNTGKLLSETTFSPGDTPRISVIRIGDVNQDFDPTAITNHAPILTGKTTLNLDENNTFVSSLVGTDADGNILIYSITGGGR